MDADEGTYKISAVLGGTRPGIPLGLHHSISVFISSCQGAVDPSWGSLFTICLISADVVG